MFHWVSNLDLNRIEVNHFTLVVFGLTKSPFTSEGKLKVHINNYKSVYPDFVEKIINGLYVNALVLGRNILSDIEEINQKYMELLLKMGSISGTEIYHYYKKTDSNNNNELPYTKQLFLNKSTSKITDLG